jgi:hypothetical protein
VGGAPEQHAALYCAPELKYYLLGIHRLLKVGFFTGEMDDMAMAAREVRGGGNCSKYRKRATHFYHLRQGVND